jgi:hypothetical protein
MDLFLEEFEELLEKHDLIYSLPQVFGAIVKDYPNTNFDDFLSSHISVDEAAEVAFSSESVCEDYFEQHGIQPQLIIEHFDTEALSYYLAFEEPDKATALFKALEYYRNAGRI